MASLNIPAITLTAASVGSSSADIANQFGMFAHVIIDITALSGTAPTLTVTVEGRDATSGKYYPILVSAALAAVATTVLRIFPGAAATANLSANDFMPTLFRVSVAIAGTTPAVTARIAININD